MESLSSTLSPLTNSKLDHYLSKKNWGIVRNCKQRQSFWSTYVKWNKQISLHWWGSWHCFVCNTDSPIHIHKFITPEVWKAFNVGIKAWNIAAVLYSNGVQTKRVSPFSWRSFHTHFKVYQMWPACYSCMHKRCSKPEACSLLLLSRQDFDKR